MEWISTDQEPSSQITMIIASGKRDGDEIDPRYYSFLMLNRTIWYGEVQGCCEGPEEFLSWYHIQKEYDLYMPIKDVE